VDLAFKYGRYKQAKAHPDVQAADLQRILLALTDGT
jgi:hypothetical protein